MTPVHRNWRISSAPPGERRDPETGELIEVDELRAVVYDPDRAVTYRVTLGRGAEGVWLTSLSITRDEDAPVDTATVRRVPVQRLAEAVATHFAREAALWAYDVEDVPEDATLKGDVPTSAQVERLLLDGETRHTIAARFNRTPSTVSDWIGKAYRERPDTMPPRRKGGRRPAHDQQATDGDRRRSNR